MKLVSAPVLGAAAVLTGPALWAAFVTGQLPTDTAVLRYAVVAVLTWAALSAWVALVGEPPRPEKPAPPEDSEGPPTVPLAGADGVARAA
ncbi:hypothetical protein [Nocardioides pantholopis]|uniref:hypothetical protein n=1 Tax=Nocardioides pantholopis TaxID=2483798 RepID=UPI000F097A05|nr:hypothetical protein [Nocardioides pantholopis]